MYIFNFNYNSSGTDVIFLVDRLRIDRAANFIRVRSNLIQASFD